MKNAHDLILDTKHTNVLDSFHYQNLSMAPPFGGSVDISSGRWTKESYTSPTEGRVSKCSSMLVSLEIGTRMTLKIPIGRGTDMLFATPDSRSFGNHNCNPK